MDATYWGWGKDYTTNEKPSGMEGLGLVRQWYDLADSYLCIR